MKKAKIAILAACPIVAGILWYSAFERPGKTELPLASSPDQSVDAVLAEADKALQLAETARNIKLEATKEATAPQADVLPQEWSEQHEQVKESVTLLEESNEQLKDLDAEFEVIQKRKKAGDQSKEVLEAETRHFEKRQEIINQLALSLKAKETDTK